MIYQIFKEAALRYPSSTALIDSDGKQWTYRELDLTIQKGARFLYALGIRAQDNIAVRLDNEDLHVIIFLSLSYLNAAYIPFEKEIPQQSFQQDLQRLQVKRCLVDDDFSIDALSKYEQHPAVSNELDTQGSSISYWVSSSGTTGKKKWIPILGNGLTYWAKQLRSLLALNENEKVLATRSPAYDARIFEYLTAFSNGATLCLISRNERKDFQAILNQCERQQITSLLFIASQFQPMDTNELMGRFKQAGLKHLLVTGDACTPYLKQVCEHHHVLLWNCYGPTEATFGYSMLCVNGLNVWSDDRQSIVPIGKAWGDDVRHHIIDDKLYIESPYLTPGFLNPEEDHHYFRLITTDTGIIRLFDTQDRFMEDNGYLYFQGRWNFESHCKVNGVKVTPHFIESIINDYHRHNPLISIQAAVVIKSYLGQEKPFAYVVISDNFNASAFHHYLKTYLKSEEWPVMIPLDELPRMHPSEKIDRQALIRRHDDVDAWWSVNDGITSVAPMLEQVRDIWKTVLQRRTVPDDVEFIVLGGTSITAVQLACQIQNTLDSTFGYQDLLQLDQITVQKIANRLVNKKNAVHELFDRALIQPLLNSTHLKNKTPLFFLPALLGEGYFSYRELAASMFAYLPQPMYGLTDPGTIDDEALPRDIHHAVLRYIAAIKTVQPVGPYELLGFSFGSTLAYEVTKVLLAQGNTVNKLYLVDSFPPMIYQALNESDSAALLQALMHFLLPILNNGFYGENLNPAHAESGFLRLRKQLKNHKSHQLLTIAERHLAWMGTLPIPTVPLPVCPMIYFTKRHQTYLNIINQVGLSSLSADYCFFGWNRYFTEVRKSGIELSCEHLGVLKAENHPQQYWRRAHDDLFNLNFDYYGPTSCYEWQEHQNESTLTLFFLTQSEAVVFENRLQSNKLLPALYLHEKRIEKYEQKDKLFYSLFTLTCQVPHALQETILTLLRGYDRIYSQPLRLRQDTNSARQLNTQPIDLHLIYGSMIYMTLTFYIDVAPSIVIQALHQQLNYPKVPEMLQQRLTYFLILRCVETFKAIKDARQEIISFISVLKPAFASSTKYYQSYPQKSVFFQSSVLDTLCKKYKLPDQSQSSLEKGLRNAVANNQLSDIKVFLKADIDINGADKKQSKTALYWAVSKGYEDCADFLRAHGARDEPLSSILNACV